jgi:hypothetical protein
VVEDLGSILLGPGRRIRAVIGPEDIQQFLVGYLAWIIVDLDGLAVIAYIVVGGIRGRATGIANAGSYDARETPELGVGSPESTHGKGRGLDVVWRSPIH